MNSLNLISLRQRRILFFIFKFDKIKVLFSFDFYQRSFEKVCHKIKENIRIFFFLFFFYARYSEFSFKHLVQILLARSIPCDVCAIPAGTTKIANRFERMRIKRWSLRKQIVAWWHLVNSCFAKSEKAKRKHRSMTQITLFLAAHSVFESRLEREKREIR